MINKLDFTLSEDLIFRFYTSKSSCHGFHDYSPKSWDEVYKVYYSYDILDIDGEVLFHQFCDEGSCIDEVSFVCDKLSDGIKEITKEDGTIISLLNHELRALGYGTSWIINEVKRINFIYTDDEETEYSIYNYIFNLFDWNDVGFRFELDVNKMKEFGKYLSECCEYMLKNSVGI